MQRIKSDRERTKAPGQNVLWDPQEKIHYKKEEVFKSISSHSFTALRWLKLKTKLKKMKQKITHVDKDVEKLKTLCTVRI